MAAISSAILAATAVAGTSASIYGQVSQSQAQKSQADAQRSQQQAQAQFQREQADIQRNAIISGQPIQQAQIENQKAQVGIQLQQSDAQAVQQRIEIEAQQRQEALRKQVMELDAARSGREILRTQQRARSLALSTSVGSGAGRSNSALSGAYGQIAGQTGVNALGLSQQLDIGRQNFGINEGLSQSRIDYSNTLSGFSKALAGLQTQNYDYQGQLLDISNQAALRTQEANYKYAGSAASAANQYGNAASQAALGAGISGIGGSLLQGSSLLSKIGQGFGTSSGTGSMSTYGGFLGSIGSNGLY